MVLRYESTKYKATLRWWWSGIGLSTGKSKAQTPGKKKLN